MISYPISLVAGIILLIVSLFTLKQSLNFIRHGERAIGTVIELEEVSSDGTIGYAPIFNIKKKNGEYTIYHHSSVSRPASWDIGEKATFLYDPNDPHSMTLLTYFDVFSWTIIFMGLAVYLITTGGGYYFLKRHLRSASLKLKEP